MTKRQERGRELFLSGYNCAYTYIYFADVLGLTEEQAGAGGRLALEAAWAGYEKTVAHILRW